MLARRRGPDEMERPWGILRVIPFKDVGEMRWRVAAFVSDVNADHAVPCFSKSLTHAARPGEKLQNFER